ncbi:hypothetical protein [Bifidobacterium sp. A11]|uniref:hypothetical protein n=1 Tax=Bifidobacterium sp. A11 TaxID=1394176 RepID=UPI000425DC6E|nr:hypothetical protein [Bifidobacterium sp. A11]
MRIVKYRPKYWLIILCALGELLNGIEIGKSISTHNWAAMSVCLIFAFDIAMIIVNSIASSYVTIVGQPADVGPDMKATTFSEES